MTPDYWGRAAVVVFDMGGHQYGATVHNTASILRFYEENRERIKGATVADYGTIHPPALHRTLRLCGLLGGAA
jgi:hypothetical protein